MASRGGSPATAGRRAGVGVSLSAAPGGDGQHEGNISEKVRYYLTCSATCAIVLSDV